jgi:hypothetical protein
MILFEHAARAICSILLPATFSVRLIVVAWLMFAQPGMSVYWLIDPEVHAQIDAEVYGQTTHGATLPGHEHHPPHEHPVTPGISLPGLTLVNPFDASFYQALLSPAQRLALFGHRVELAVIGQSIAIEPPDQPPRRGT